jgi:SAM-dependent methyltransferase
MRANLVTDTLVVYQGGLETYLSHWGRRRYRVPPLLREGIRTFPPGGRVLDLGCGPAQDTRYLAKQGYGAVGVDAVGEFLSWARAKDRGTRLVRSDIRRLPFGPATFDAVWAAASLIHLSKRDLRFSLAALRSVVAPGGRLVATLLHGTTSGTVTTGWLPGRYVSRWTKEELRAAVTRAGWEIERLTTVTNRESKGRWLNLIAKRPKRG